MSLTIGANDLISVRLNYWNGDAASTAYNVLYYKIATSSGAPPLMSAALAAIASAMFTKWSALWKVAAGPDTEMIGVTAVNVFPLPRSVSQTYVAPTPVPGDQPGDSIPLQDAPTLLKKSEVGNRWGSGRLFYVGLAENMQDGGQVEAGGIVALNNMGAALADSVSVTLGGWSASLAPVLKRGPEDNPVSLTPITSGRLSDIIIKSQLRRRTGKGI